MELALLARAYPQQFQAFAIAHEEILPNGNVKVHTLTFGQGGQGLNFKEAMGLFEAAKMRTWEKSCL